MTASLRVNFGEGVGDGALNPKPFVSPPDFGNPFKIQNFLAGIFGNPGDPRVTKSLAD